LHPSSDHDREVHFLVGGRIQEGWIARALAAVGLLKGEPILAGAFPSRSGSQGSNTVIGAGHPIPPLDWEALWVPYDEPTYHAALAYLNPGMTILDIGAGDLRFARRAVAKGCRVIAVERQADAVQRGLLAGALPDGLHVIQADAREWAFPAGLDAAVLLMRHCASYRLYVRKLRDAGCLALITNARWRLGVEKVPLVRAASYEQAQMGWYACVSCGQVGFIPGDPAELTQAVEQDCLNVEGCPHCAQDRATCRPSDTAGSD
jgi:SAM-dependent methyltransferase